LLKISIPCAPSAFSIQTVIGAKILQRHELHCQNFVLEPSIVDERLFPTEINRCGNLPKDQNIIESLCIEIIIKKAILSKPQLSSIRSPKTYFLILRKIFQLELNSTSSFFKKVRLFNSIEFKDVELFIYVA
jgi:hypothetical protein